MNNTLDGDKVAAKAAARNGKAVSFIAINIYQLSGWQWP